MRRLFAGVDIDDAVNGSVAKCFDGERGLPHETTTARVGFSQIGGQRCADGLTVAVDEPDVRSALAEDVAFGGHAPGHAAVVPVGFDRDLHVGLKRY